MQPIDLYAMFCLGIFGTGHCLGMCGPLVLAFPSSTGRIVSHGLYHLGRITTYTAVGVAMGAAGTGIAKLASMAGGNPLVWTTRIQIVFSGAAALSLLILGLARIQLIKEPGWMSIASPEKIPGGHKVFQSTASAGGNISMFICGLLLGFLPCGLSFAAFSRALAADGALAGGALTLVFGLGTLPGLFLVGVGASGLARRYRSLSDLISGILMIGMGASLAADGFQAIVG